MFPVDQLQRFQVINPDHKFIKPWWDTFTDYIVTALLMMAVLAGVMQATQSDLVCVPAIDCSLSHNQSVNHSGVCQGSKSTMLLKLPDRRLYDYVETVCGRTAVHWFVAYFPFIIFLEAIILIVIQNFWLKYPVTASIIDQFVSLVIECHNIPWTSSALEYALSKVNMHEENKDNESRSGDTSKNQNTSTSAFLDEMECIKAKALYEKVCQFRKDTEKKKKIYCLPCIKKIVCIQSIRKIFLIHFIQVLVQFIASVTTFVINICYHSALNNDNIMCKIDDIIDQDYSYFKCTNDIVSYLEVTNITFCILIGLYIIFSFCNLIFCSWTFIKIVENKLQKQNISSNHQSNENHSAKGDLLFLLSLLKKCSKLHYQRFSQFISKKTEKEIKDQILMNEWPSKRLEKIAEDDGRALQLFNLQDGIPKTIFKMEELKFLRLEKCNLQNVDLQNADLQNVDFWKSIVSLSLVECCLTVVPDIIPGTMKSLVQLDLSHNNIVTIPQNINQLECLRYLDVSYNNISEGVDNLLQMQTLVKLNLRGNDSIKLKLNHQQEIKLMKLEISDDVLPNDHHHHDIVVTPSNNGFVIKYLPERAPQIEDMRKSNKIYKITSQQKGLVVILDMMAENVHQEVKRVFEEIGYTVKEVSVDSFRSIEELKKSLRDCFLDCKNYDSAILIMTCKGYVDKLYVGDTALLGIDQIDECIRNRILQSKPKLVFLQVDSPAKDPNDISRPPRKSTYPDTFIACTVCYGFQGANQFFETLVEVFSNYAWEEDLLSLMTSVKYELSRKFRDKEYEHSYLPKVGGLKKKLYFFPGYHDNSETTAL